MEEKEMHTGIIVGTSEGKKSLGKPRCKHKYNIKLCVKKNRIGELRLDAYIKNT
jgi:hypothetical protein